MKIYSSETKETGARVWYRLLGTINTKVILVREVNREEEEKGTEDKHLKHKKFRSLTTFVLKTLYTS